MEEAADLLATRASNFLHELFPARQWRQAMTLMVQRINRTVAEDDAGGLAELRGVSVSFRCSAVRPVSSRP